MSNFSIGIMESSFRTDLETTVRKAVQYGADGLQLSVRDGVFAPERMTRDKIQYVKGLMAANGLIISAVCGDLGGHGFAVAADNPRKIDISKRILEIAQELGASVVTTHIGCVPKDRDSERFEVLWNACNQLGAYADSLGMKFAIETGPERAAELKAFLDSLQNRGMAVNLDPANLVMVTEDDPVRAVYTLRDYIVHTHAKDGKNLIPCDAEKIYNNFAEETLEDIEYFLETPLGQGNVDFDAYLAALRDIGYHGFLTIEREVGPDPEADIALAIEFLQSKI